MRWLKTLLLAGGLLLAGVGEAATYWISPTGTSGASGADSLTNAKSLSWFFGNADPGDVGLLSHGTFAMGSSANFSNNGTSGAGRISLIGDITYPSTVDFGSGTLNLFWFANDYFSIKGIKVGEITLAGSDALGAALVDSIAYCVIDSSFGAGRMDNCVIASNRIGNGGMENGFSAGTQGAYSFSNQIISNSMNLGLAAGGSLNNIMNLNRLTGTTISQNRVSTRHWANASTSVHTNTWFCLRNSTISDNYFSVRNDIPNTEMYFLNLRDSTAFNTFARDTFLVDTLSLGFSKIKFSTGGALPGTVKYNTYNSCIFRVNGDLGYQDIARGDVHKFNQYISRKPFTVSTGNAASDSVTMSHNTFLVDAGTALDLPFDSTSVYKPTNWRLTSNIFYTSSGAHGPHVDNKWHTGWGVRDTNLVYGVAGDSQNAYDRPAGTGDLATAWGDPIFVNNRWETFDLRPLSTGPVKNDALWADGYVGAIAPAAPPVAVTITTTLMPNARISYSYAKTLVSTGGASPYTWTVTAGSLPDGLSLDEFSAVVGGVPTVEGTFTFTVTATDDLLATDTQELSITVTTGTGPQPRKKWWWWW